MIYQQASMDLMSKVAVKFAHKYIEIERKKAKAKFVENHHRYIIPRTGHFCFALRQIEDISGAIAEAGVRGGESLATMVAISRSFGTKPNRKIYGFDSYEGFPDQYEIAGKTFTKAPPKMSPDNAMERVKMVLKRAGLSDKELSDVHLIPGYFSESLKNFDTGPIALLHLDVDLGKSYTEALEGLYHHVVHRGLVLFDEYDDPKDLEKWPDAKPSIDRFFKNKKIERLHSGFMNKLILRKLD